MRVMTPISVSRSLILGFSVLRCHICMVETVTDASTSEFWCQDEMSNASKDSVIKVILNKC